MRKEQDRKLHLLPKITKMNILRGTLAVTAAVTFQAMRNPQNTELVYKYYTDQSVECFNRVDSENEAYPFDAIVVLSGGVGLTPEGESIPNDFYKLRLEAAAISYIRGQAPRIIIHDGKMDTSIDPSTSQRFLKEEVSRLSGGKTELPDNAIIQEKDSLNTAGNIFELSKLVEQFNLNNLFLISNFFHLDRATMNSCARDLNVYPKAAEDIIIEFDPSREGLIREFYASKQLDNLILKENLVILESLVDPEGFGPILINEFSHGN